VLKQIGDFIKQIASLTLDTQRNKAEIKQLQEQMQEVLDELRQIQFDNRRDRENAVYERENLLLRLEVTLLRAGQKGLIVTETPRPLLGDSDEQK